MTAFYHDISSNRSSKTAFILTYTCNFILMLSYTFIFPLTGPPRQAPRSPFCKRKVNKFFQLIQLNSFQEIVFGESMLSLFMMTTIMMKKALRNFCHYFTIWSFQQLSLRTFWQHFTGLFYLSK